MQSQISNIMAALPDGLSIEKKKREQIRIALEPLINTVVESVWNRESENLYNLINSMGIVDADDMTEVEKENLNQILLESEEFVPEIATKDYQRLSDEVASKVKFNEPVITDEAFRKPRKRDIAADGLRHLKGKIVQKISRKIWVVPRNEATETVLGVRLVTTLSESSLNIYEFMAAKEHQLVGTFTADRKTEILGCVTSLGSDREDALFLLSRADGAIWFTAYDIYHAEFTLLKRLKIVIVNELVKTWVKNGQILCGDDGKPFLLLNLLDTRKLFTDRDQERAVIYTTEDDSNSLLPKFTGRDSHFIGATSFSLEDETHLLAATTMRNVDWFRLKEDNWNLMLLRSIKVPDLDMELNYWITVQPSRQIFAIADKTTNNIQAYSLLDGEKTWSMPQKEQLLGIMIHDNDLYTATKRRDEIIIEKIEII